MGRARSGFSLVEIAIVVSLLMVILAIAIPNYRNQALRRDQDAAREELAALLSYARQTAVERGGSVVSVMPSPTPMRFDVRQGNGNLLKTYQVPANITVTLPASQVTYTYQPNGSVSTGGDFVFGVSGNPTMATSSLTLDATTGATTLR